MAKTIIPTEANKQLPGSANRFRRFFLREGVVFGVMKTTHPPMKSKTTPTALVIDCGQTHFHFDEAGEYLGLEWDEMGEWEERVKE